MKLMPFSFQGTMLCIITTEEFYCLHSQLQSVVQTEEDTNSIFSLGLGLPFSPWLSRLQTEGTALSLRGQC